MGFPLAHTHVFDVVHHDTSDEPDVNTGGKEMDNQQAQVTMVLMFNRMLQEQRAISEVTVAVERLGQRHG